MTQTQRWGSAAMYMAVTGTKERTFYRKVQAGKIASRENTVGKKEFLLPENRSDTTALALPQQHHQEQQRQQTHANESSLIGIPAAKLPRAQQKFEAIQPLLDFKRRCKSGERPQIRVADGTIVTNLRDLADHIGSQQNPPISWQTLLRDLSKFEKASIVGIARKFRSDKGHSRAFSDNAEAAGFLLGKYFNEGLSIQMAWEALVREWPRIGKGDKAPSYGAARTFINAHPQPLKVLGREGPHAYYSKCSPSIQRARVNPMDWWVGDNREFDVLKRNTLYAELPPQKAFRIWMTAIFDWGSRKLVGWCFAPTPSSRTINSALRMAILAHGMPRNFYWDNGADYKKVRRDLETVMLSDDAGSLLAHARVGVTTALPFHPRSKPIESWFARWSKRFDPIWRPAYLGNRPTSRPESAELAQKRHREFLKGQRAHSPLPTDAEFLAATIQFIEEENDAPREALQNRTPNQAMEEAWPERCRKPVNPRLLDILFAERDERKVMAGGCVQLDNRKYEPTDEYLVAMDYLQGRSVMVARDPYNLQTAVAADPETLQFIAELRIQEFVGQCPGGRFTRDQIKANARRQGALRRGYSEYLAGLQTLAVASDWKTEREALLERAGLRTGTDNRLALPSAAVPGAASSFRALPPTRRHVQPAFISDAVAEDRDVFKDLKLDEGTED